MQEDERKQISDIIRMHCQEAVEEIDEVTNGGLIRNLFDDATYAIAGVLEKSTEEDVIAAVKKAVAEICDQYEARRRED